MQSSCKTIGEFKELLNRYPDSWQLAIELQKQDGTVEWIIEPKDYRYARLILFEGE